MTYLTSDLIALLALIISLISLLVSIVNSYKDKHKISARGTIFESPKKPNIWHLSITTSNKGKRPVSVSFVTVKPRKSNGYSMQYDQNEHPVPINVGSSASRVIFTEWKSIKEIKNCKIYVQDALGKNHRVKF